MIGKRKKVQDTEMDYLYIQALKSRKIPLLTLDPRWHQLFPDHRKTDEIKHLEKKLNKLIQKQGQTSNDLKDYEKAKKVLMQNIVNNMTDGHEHDSPVRQRKQEKNQKLMNELKDKITQAEDLQESLPQDIKLANDELLIASMRVCYGELVFNTERIEAEEQLIVQMREELKNHILQKQEMEMRNTELYKYMHNLLGAEIVEVFDREHQIWKGNLEENKLDAE